MAHSDRTTHTLSFEDAVQVWQLRRDGWFQHRIAARFDVNPGRISDVLNERKHLGSRAVAERDGGHHG